MDIALGQSIELRFEFRVELIHVAHVNVVRIAPVAGRCAVGSALFQDTEAHRLAMQIRVIFLTKDRLKAEDVVEKRQRLFNVIHVHERCDLDKI
jgi:hypothetical protein